MNFFKRIFLSITRRKAKVSILFLVVFILGNLIATSIAIQQSSKNVENNIKEKLGAIATVEPDYAEIQKSYENNPEDTNVNSLTTKKIKELANTPYVKYYDYSTQMWTSSDTLKEVTSNNSTNTETQNAEIDGEFQTANFLLKGIEYPAVLDFKEKKATLLSGRTFQNNEIKNGSNTTIISKSLAEKNNLSLNDTLTLKHYIYDYNIEDTNSDEINGALTPSSTKDLSLKIIGIFEPKLRNEETAKKNTNNQVIELDFLESTAQNTLYVANALVINEQKQVSEASNTLDDDSSINQTYYLPTFVLKNSEQLPDFIEDTKPLLPKLYKINSTNDQYQSISAPIQSVNKLAEYLLIAAVIASLLIVSLLILLFLRDQKHEFGIYLSLGESKSQLILKVLTETLIIAMIAFSISMVSGKLLANILSDNLIQSQITAEAQATAPDTMFSESILQATNLTQDDVIKEYHIQFSINYILSFFAIGLVTIILSTVIPMAYLLRLNPKKIML